MRKEEEMKNLAQSTSKRRPKTRWRENWENKYQMEGKRQKLNNFREVKYEEEITIPSKTVSLINSMFDCDLKDCGN